MSKVTRRLIIGSGLALPALGAGSYLSCTRHGNATTARLDRLDVMLDDIIDVTRIGSAARAAFSYEVLYAEAQMDSQIATALNIECTVSRRAYLRNASSSDFAKKKIVLCDRFVLSRTETIVAGLRGILSNFG